MCTTTPSPAPATVAATSHTCSCTHSPGRADCPVHGSAQVRLAMRLGTTIATLPTHVQQQAAQHAVQGLLAAGARVWARALPQGLAAYDAGQQYGPVPQPQGYAAQLLAQGWHLHLGWVYGGTPARATGRSYDYAADAVQQALARDTMAAQPTVARVTDGAWGMAYVACGEEESALWVGGQLRAVYAAGDVLLAAAPGTSPQQAAAWCEMAGQVIGEALGYC